MLSARALRSALALSVSLWAVALTIDRPLADQQLSGAALDRAVSGRRIFLATPLGGEFPLNYHADGRVDGQGEAAGLGRFMRPTDTGRWWVSGEKLCQKWTTWYDGKVFCFTLQRVSESQLAWRRDDGLAGLARVGR